MTKTSVIVPARKYAEGDTTAMRGELVSPLTSTDTSLKNQGCLCLLL